MITLDLTDPQASDIAYSIITFPDGQPHIKIDAAALEILDSQTPVSILARITNSDELLLILFAKNVLDRFKPAHIELHLCYLMTSRMDRVMQPGEPFSLEVVAAIINGAEFSKVKIFDPHSAVTTTLLQRAEAINNHAFVGDAIAHYLNTHKESSYTLVSPDAGAAKKIYDLADALGGADIVACKKVRDVKTGQLSGFSTNASELNGITCFIIDDICDGGGTFVGTAKVLREKGAGRIVLIVSHGIFSRGVPLDGIEAIYATDSYKKHDHLVCLPVAKYMK